MNSALPQQLDVLVVGAGFAGLAAVAKILAADPSADVTVIERASEVGGTWRDNTYPGCACDVPTSLYSFSFAPSPKWSHTFARQPELFDYLRSVVDRLNLRDRIVTDCELLSADWSRHGPAVDRADLEGCGERQSPRGRDRRTVDAEDPRRAGHRHIPGNGVPLRDVEPRARSHRGARRRDRHRSVGGAVRARDRRQGRSGSPSFNAHRPGSSRAWTAPSAGSSGRCTRRSPRLIARFAASSTGTARHTSTVLADNPWMLPAVKAFAKANLKRQVKNPTTAGGSDPRLRTRLQTSSAVQRLAADAGSTRRRPGDIGPDVGDRERRRRRVGPQRTRWTPSSSRRASPRPNRRCRICCAAATVVRSPSAGAAARRPTWAPPSPGFPNLFLMYGPNTNLGHSSIVYMLESQANYVVSALQRDAGPIMQPPSTCPNPPGSSTTRGSTSSLDGTVWNAGGCSSWYLDANGRNSAMWPTFTFRFRNKTPNVRHLELPTRLRHP